jgi:hypothetical protein
MQLILVILALVTTLGACRSDDDAASATTDPPASTTSAPTTTTQLLTPARPSQTQEKTSSVGSARSKPATQQRPSFWSTKPKS